MATLRVTVLEGPDAKLSATLTGDRMVFGRSPDVDFALHDDSVSRQHLAVERDGPGFVVVDLGSHNGSFVEGEKAKISRRALVGGERIRLGRTVLGIEIKGATAATPTPVAAAAPLPAAATGAQKPSDLPIVLTVVSGPDRGMVYSPPKDTITIGRRANCDVPLNDLAASRLHATIKREAGGYVIYDENSRYGTFLVSLNKTIFHAPLRNDDVIRIGDTQIRASIGSVAQATTRNEPNLSATIHNKTFSMTLRNVPTLRDPPALTDAVGDATVAASTEPGASSVAAAMRLPEAIIVTVIGGNDRGRRIEIPAGARLTVGRGDKANVRLADPAISSIHLSLQESHGSLVVRDEGSRNGTFLGRGSERVSERTLHAGDVVRIGDSELRVEASAAGAAPTPVGDQTLAMSNPPQPAPAEPEKVAPAEAIATPPPSPATDKPTTKQKPHERVPELARHAEAKQRISKIMKGVSLRPVRKAGTGRQWATVGMLGLTILTCLAFPRTWLSAGPVHEGHAKIEGSCETCHSTTTGGRLLSITGFHAADEVMNASCSTVDCHAKQLRQKSEVRDDCISCHVEHRGRTFPIRGGENLCWSCHLGQASPQDFDSRLMKVSFTTDAALKARLVPRLLPPLEVGLKFSHEAHDKETRGDTRFDSCVGCHTPIENNRTFALPSHAQCLECHDKAVSADVKAAAAQKGPGCLECHTREDGEMVEPPPSRFAYVSFSHQDHKDEFCKSCHASVWTEGPYQSVKRATELFPVAMDACVTCHRQKSATVACLDCHREHHSFPPSTEASVIPGGGHFDRWLLAMLTLAFGAGAYVYADARMVRSWLAKSDTPPQPAATGLAKPTEVAAQILPFPKVDVEACISCSSCYNSCPKQVLAGDDHGKSTVVNPDSCIALEGCAVCEQGCPTGAIRVSTAPLKRTVERPEIDEHNEAKIPGLFFAGEVIGAALIKSAINQGNQDVAFIAEKKPKIADAAYDVIVVGAGPAGLGAGLEAKRRGLRYLVLERDTVASTIKNYPRDKAVLAEPVKMPLYGQLPMMDADKTTLMAVWETIVKTTGLEVKEFEEVLDVKKVDALLEVKTAKAVYRGANVVLAIGTRGDPRKLGCAGESPARVAYNLIDAAELRGKSVIVVGGGDSAIEAAVALGRQADTKVILSYRKGEFSRVKKRNLDQIKEMSKSGQVEVLFNSAILEIGAENVRVKTQAGEREVACDRIYALIGADPPKAWIEKLGVAFVIREEEVVTW